ncbi:MAG: CRR6 family NdhI maturation factor [Cyanobacteria bacterium REEB459]|nr:CRR6 family NdhI maturation factor [Cyanobacteria bacterium REEB459]
MAQTITLSAAHLQSLDLTPALTVIEPLLAKGDILKENLALQFAINLDRDPTDPRELSELPEVRLWFIRLDGHYPWLPLVLDWEAGELARYAAMVVPHQFSPTDGIRYNPEALEIFIMNKIFVTTAWLNQQGSSGYGRVKFMAQTLGYEIEEGLFNLLEP